MRRIAIVGVLTASLIPLAGRSAGPTDVAGIPAANVGVHGPVAPHLDGLRLVGSTAIAKPGRKPALGNNGAVTLLGDCAFVGRWHDYNESSRRNGVSIIDIADRTAPAYVGEIAATIRPGGVAREIRAIDLPNLKMLVVLIFSQALGDRSNNLVQTYTFPSGSCREPVLTGTFNMVAFRGHEFFLWVDPDGTHNVDGSPRVLAFITAPVSAPNLLVADLSRPATPLPVGLYDAGQPVVSPNEPAGTYLGNYAHSLSLSDDGREVYVSYWDGGYFTADASAFALGGGGTFTPAGARSVPLRYGLEEFGNTHSAVKVPGSNHVVVGDEIYISTDGCPFGWMRLIDIGDAVTPPSQRGEFRLAENRPENCDPATKQVTSRNSLGNQIDGTFSMHNQTLVGRYALVSWYGGGMRIVDVADPAQPAEVGAFVPVPVADTDSKPSTSAPIYRSESPTNTSAWWVSMWSYPVVRDGLIYVVDTRNGLFILEPAPGAPFAEAVATTSFSEGNSNLGAFGG